MIWRLATTLCAIGIAAALAGLVTSYSRPGGVTTPSFHQTDFSPSPRYTLHLNLGARGLLCISWSTNYCPRCRHAYRYGQVEHEPSCPYRGAFGDPGFVPSRKLVPGLYWTNADFGEWITKELGISLWIPLLLLSVQPVIATIRGPLRRSRRRRRGRCLRCGYDLTGNDSGRCPECGEPHRAATAC